MTFFVKFQTIREILLTKKTHLCFVFLLFSYLCNERLRLMKSIIMKRWLLLALSCWMLSVAVEAAPALRMPVTVNQPDGTLLTVRQFGDEWYHWTAISDGTLVVSTPKGYCVAQIDERGRLKATDVLAHEPAQRSRQEQAVVTQQAARRALFHEQGRKAATRTLAIEDCGFLPHSGSPRVLTVLAQFQDVGFTVNDPVQAFDQYLNGDEMVDLGNRNQMNQSSVRKYFETCSQGKFSPQFDVVGPITLPYNLKYYGEDSDRTDPNFWKFCYDVTEQIEDKVDFRPYDNDGDGNVELVCIIFAGFGQNGGGGDSTLWAKAGQIDLQLTEDMRIGFFNCCSELIHPQLPDMINGNGVFIHEFSHCMGLPDLYALNEEAYIDNQGMEAYSIMDYGLYNRNGCAPCPYTAWEQEVMGWTEIVDVGSLMADGTCQIDDVPPLIEGGKAFKLVNSSNERDYIVMENIQQRGLNEYAYGHGLLVYHVDYPKEVVNMYDTPNNAPGHPAVAIVPAGGLIFNSMARSIDRDERKENLASVPFPGSLEVSSLSNEMQLPNYCFYDGEAMNPVGMKLSEITEDVESGNVSFTVSPDDATGIHEIAKESSGDRALIFDLLGCQWQGSLKPGVYIIDGKKKVVK